MNATENLYKCPTDDNTDELREGEKVLLGCGFVFWASPDDEGLVDCPECGIWFKPRPQDVVE